MKNISKSFWAPCFEASYSGKGVSTVYIFSHISVQLGQITKVFDIHRSISFIWVFTTGHSRLMLTCTLAPVQFILSYNFSNRNMILVGPGRILFQQISQIPIYFMISFLNLKLSYPKLYLKHTLYDINSFFKWIKILVFGQSISAYLQECVPCSF